MFFKHRSQLDYDLVMRNYGLNLAFQLRKVGIITAQSSEYYPENLTTLAFIELHTFILGNGKKKSQFYHHLYANSYFVRSLYKDNGKILLSELSHQ